MFRTHLRHNRVMRCCKKALDARREAQRMVVRLRPGIAPAQVREQPLSAPFAAERYFRISFATSMDNLRNALDRIEKALK